MEKTVQIRVKNGAAWDDIFPKTKAGNVSTTDGSNVETKISNLNTGKADVGHTHPTSDITGLGTAATKNTGTASGNVPVLDTNGKIDTTVLPALAISNTYVVATQAAMLALTAEVGDVAVRTDLNKSFILKTAGASTLANWQELLTPTDSVSSVAGKTGVVTLTASDVGLGNVTNESKTTMFTSPALTGTPTAPTAIAGTNTIQIATTAFVQTGLNGKADTVHTHTTTDVTGLDTALSGKQATITGAASTITSSNLTASRAVVSDGTGKVAASTVTSTELGYMSGVTSAVQTQLNGKANTTHTHVTGDVTGLDTALAGKQATITGAATTITSLNLTASRAVVSDGTGKVAASTVTSTELGYMSGVTSAVQTQLNAKQASITGAATTITSSNLTASRAVVSDGTGKVAVSAVTSTELGYLSGVTSSVQTQLNGKSSVTVSGTAPATGDIWFQELA